MNNIIRKYVARLIWSVASIGILTAGFELAQVLLIKEFLGYLSGAVELSQDVEILSIRMNFEFLCFIIIIIFVSGGILKITSLALMTQLSFGAQRKLSVEYVRLFVRANFRSYEKEYQTVVTDVVTRTNLMSFYYYIPICNIIIHSLLLVVLIGSLLFIDFKITLFLFTFVIGSYSIFIAASNARLRLLSLRIKDSQEKKNSLLHFFYFAYKDIFNTNDRQIPLDDFNDNENTLYRSVSESQLISFIPRHLIEVFGIIGVIFICIYMWGVDQVLLREMMPALLTVVFGMSRCVPSAQQVYGAFVALKTGSESKNTFIANINELYIQNEKLDSSELPSFKTISVSFTSRELHEVVSIEIKNGQKVLIKGPSGCGKTSLLESIAGFNSLFDVHIDSVKLSDENALSWSRQFSFVSQSYSQFPSQFLVGNVKSNDSWRDKRYTEFFSKYVDQIDVTLSGGEKQRLCVLRSLDLNRGLILLDEPISALDSKSGFQLMSDLAAQDKTVICVLHSNDYDDLFDVIYDLS